MAAAVLPSNFTEKVFLDAMMNFPHSEVTIPYLCTFVELQTPLLLFSLWFLKAFYLNRLCFSLQAGKSNLRSHFFSLIDIAD